jgi:hypothetical protein
LRSGRSSATSAMPSVDLQSEMFGASASAFGSVLSPSPILLRAMPSSCRPDALSPDIEPPSSSSIQASCLRPSRRTAPRAPAGSAAPVARRSLSTGMRSTSPSLDQPVDDAGDIAVRDRSTPEISLIFSPPSGAVQRRHHVEARQRGVEPARSSRNSASMMRCALSSFSQSRSPPLEPPHHSLLRRYPTGAVAHVSPPDSEIA